MKYAFKVNEYAFEVIFSSVVLLLYIAISHYAMRWNNDGNGVLHQAFAYLLSANFIIQQS